MDKTVAICLVLSIHAASSNSVTSPPRNTTNNQEFLSTKPISTYEVTENVIDIPDNRTLRPILANYSITQPINIANTSVNINANTDKSDENTQLKKTTITYVHITKEEENEGKIKRLLKGIRDYLFNLKKGVVDGLHSYFHDGKRDKGGRSYDEDISDLEDIQKETDAKFQEIFHTTYDGEDVDEFEREFGDY